MSSLSYCCLSCHVRGYWHRTCFCFIIIRFLAGNSLVWSAVVAASSHVACPLACRAGSVNGALRLSLAREKTRRGRSLSLAVFLSTEVFTIFPTMKVWHSVNNDLWVRWTSRLLYLFNGQGYLRVKASHSWPAVKGWKCNWAKCFSLVCVQCHANRMQK